MTLRVASAAWKLRPVRGDAGYFGHFYDVVSAAHDEGAQVVVVPELHVLELLPLAPELEEKDAAKYLVQYGEAVEGWIKRISDSSGMMIVGGSHFKSTPEGIKNVCAIGIPGQELVLAEKNVLTGYERTVWRLAKGRGLVKLPFGLGVTVCYDSEFPESGRALAEAGTVVQCVPAWTETRHGFQRVRWSCQARAIENQVFVIHSSLVGSLGKEPVPSSYGSSAILAPSVEPFPEDPILRETVPNEEGIVVADLDIAKLLRSRRRGEVANWLDRNAGTWTVESAPEPASEPAEPQSGELN